MKVYRLTEDDLVIANSREEAISFFESNISSCEYDFEEYEEEYELKDHTIVLDTEHGSIMGNAQWFLDHNLIKVPSYYAENI